MSTTATPAKSDQPANGQTALAKIDDRTVCNVPQLKTLFEGPGVRLLQQALPSTMKRSAERLARCAVTEFSKNPALMDCTGLSILSCAVQAAQIGLEIGGVMGQCYMVPYWNAKKRVKEAQFQVGYRGMIELAFRSGHIANVYTSVVRQKDKFRMIRGTAQGIEHEPATVGAGDMYGAYAVVVYKSGQINFEWMERAEIEHHRDTYSKSWQNAKTPEERSRTSWGSAFNEMAKKTVVRKLLKCCPFAAEFRPEVLREEDDSTSLVVKAEELNLPALPVAEDTGADEPDKEPEKQPEKQPDAKPADKAPEKEPEQPAPDSEEVTEEKAFMGLLRRKGLSWSAAMARINKQFATAYEGDLNYADDVALDHRRWIVAALAAVEDVPTSKKK